MSWAPGQLLKVRFKNGADVIASARVASGRFITFSPSTRRRRAAPMHCPGRGVSITGPGGVAYQAAAIMDEPDLSYRVRLTEPRVRVGSPLSLVVDVNARQRPIDGRVTVTATVEQPRVAVQPHCRREAAGPTGTGLRARHDGAERQFAALATDTERWRH